ncbi:hypothetical protein FORC066_1179 [Yersinia enterocolitica]|nr:hypothetical protein FORC065_3245 [Yersinia enterocolitica]UXD28394.1 hypothetical protein FORC066_1179 [Yersinia enterocolitica]
MGLASLRPLQAAFKSAPGRFVTRITDQSQLIGMSSLAALLQQQWLWGSFDLLPIKKSV